MLFISRIADITVTIHNCAIHNCAIFGDFQNADILDKFGKFFLDFLFEKLERRVRWVWLVRWVRREIFSVPSQQRYIPFKTAICKNVDGSNKSSQVGLG
jgi:hypothetical protein